MKKLVDKPGSVVDNHSSGTNVTVCLKQPTRILYGPYIMILRSSGFLFGLAPSGVFPATACCQSCGALLPHHFTLTGWLINQPTGGIFSVALSVNSRLPGVTWHSALWSPDFPPSTSAESDCLTNFETDDIRTIGQWSN